MKMRIVPAIVCLLFTFAIVRAEAPSMFQFEATTLEVLPEAEIAAAKELESFALTFKDLESWKKRAAANRVMMLKTMGLSPLPARTPLNVIRHSLREFDGYSVENVAFESEPGVFVMGNLYRPRGRRGPFAGVLCPHGHWGPTSAQGYGRFRPSMQTRCAVLARMGAVVFAYDMAGWGEADDHGWPIAQWHPPSSNFHVGEMRKDKPKAPPTLRIQTWNSMRAIDFLLSLDDVDPTRIGVTGASGGGTQTFILAALDDRVAVSVPVCMVSANFQGGCSCESGMAIRGQNEEVTNSADIAAMAAPRPQLLISNGDDWTKYNAIIEVPYLKHVYGLHQAANHIDHAHFAEEKHDYGHSKRMAMYPFMAKHLKLDLAAAQNDAGEIDETKVTILDIDQLRVFNDEHPLPDHALTGEQWLANWNKHHGDHE